MNGESTNPNAQTTISIRIHTHNELKFFLIQNFLYKDDTENKICSHLFYKFGRKYDKKVKIHFLVTDVLKFEFPT